MLPEKECTAIATVGRAGLMGCNLHRHTGHRPHLGLLLRFHHLDNLNKLKNSIDVQLTYKVVLIPAAQHSDSAIRVYSLSRP